MLRGGLPDKTFDHLACFIIMILDWGRFHEVGRWREERAADVVIQRQLGTTQRIDDDTRRIRRVPDLELQLDIERYVAKGRAFDADIRPFAILEPRHIVTRADMDV